MVRRALAPTILLLLLLVTSCSARPTVILVLADTVTLDDMQRVDLPNLNSLLSRGSTAMMSEGLAKAPDPVLAVYRDIGEGDNGARANDHFLAHVLIVGHVNSALIGNASGDDTGLYSPFSQALPKSTVQFDQGQVKCPIACGGAFNDPALTWNLVKTESANANLIIVEWGDFLRIQREWHLGLLSPYSEHEHREQSLHALDQFLGFALHASTVNSSGGPVFVVFAAPTPPLHHRVFARLCPVSIVGPGFPSDGMLTSLTTHTPGLVAARDIAATLASLFNSPLADASAGSPAYPITGRQNAVIGLRAIDSETAFNQEIQTPLFWTLGVISGLFAFASLAVVLVCSRVPPTVQRCAAYGLRFIAAWPVALMIVTVFPVRSSDAYLAAIFTLVFVIALVPSVRAIYICTAIVIAADSLFGSKLISNSCFSAYYLSGIRFYGIGNEYMGLIIGGTLLAASTLWARAWPVIVRKNFVLAVFCIAVFILVYPAFGSKAGGAITSCSVFYAAFRYLHGKRVALKHIALGVGIGIVVLGVLSMLGRAFGTERTHVDIAAHAIARGHVGYILGIAFRKVGLAARIVLHPGTLLGIAAFALLAALMKKFAMEDLLKYRRERPATAAVMMASVVGAGVALLFNDSGIIAGVMLLSCVTVTLLDDLIGAKCALWHSMSAKSA